MTITTNARELISHFTRYQNTFEQKMHDFAETLAGYGIFIAKAEFRAADYSGTNDAEVSDAPVWVDDHTLQIVASGESVMFIEFGAGAFYPDDHPAASANGAIRGAYGHGRGANPPWIYRGEKGVSDAEPVLDKNGNERDGLWWTRGNPANKPMWNSAEEMRKNILDVARAVFAND